MFPVWDNTGLTVDTRIIQINVALVSSVGSLQGYGEMKLSD